MNISQSGIALLKQLEGLRKKAYQDSVGVWTIGYGSTIIDGRRVVQGDEITEQQAGEYLAHDLARFEGCVTDMIRKIKLSQNQFDALVIFAYNLGCSALGRSTLLRKALADPGDPSIRSEFMRWNKAGGKVIPGLTNRRSIEADLYFKL